MFGLLKPNSCQLDAETKAAHGRYYCGLCQSVGVHFGQAKRGIHSYDAVFLAVVADGLLQESSQRSSCRCPMLPVLHKDTQSPRSVAMTWAAAVQMLLADQWLADKSVETGTKATMARMSRPWLDPSVSIARSLLAELGAPLDALRDFETEQLAAEEVGSAVVDAARPTSNALGVVFESIANLTDAEPELNTPAMRAHLRGFGQALGQVIYWTDAFEDLEQDWVEQAFNPCLEARVGRSSRPSQKRTRDAGRLLTEAAEAMSLHEAALPWQRNASLVHATTAPLARRAQRAHAEATNQVDVLATQFEPPGTWARLSTALVSMCLVLWSMLYSVPAQASEAFSAWRNGQPLTPQTQQCCCDNAQCPCDDCGKNCPCQKCDECADVCPNCIEGCGKNVERCFDGIPCF
jgi:hypothetical protein